MMPALIRKGAVLTIESVAGAVLVTRAPDGQVHRLRLGPADGPHAYHPPPAPGDRLLVARDSAPEGDTSVIAVCGCSIVLHADYAP
jgi:hypothetical protein